MILFILSSNSTRNQSCPQMAVILVSHLCFFCCALPRPVHSSAYPSEATYALSAYLPKTTYALSAYLRKTTYALSAYLPKTTYALTTVDQVTHPVFDISHTSLHGTNIHALSFMPHLQPLRAWLGNLNYKGGHTEGDLPLPTLVQHRREQSRSATSGFRRERAPASITHRQGKCNM